jgi:heterodisulfide reductase subunit A2
MKTGVYFCNCGTNVSDKIDAEKVKERALATDGNVHFKTISFMCSEGGKEEFEKDLQANRVDRVVIAACSPREHEGTFMACMSRSNLNPYLLQMVNVREQVAWVTEGRNEATDKAARYVSAAMRRVALHDQLQKKEIDVSTDLLVIGAGPAGLKAALVAAEAGRHVTIVERSPVIGGMPVRFEDLAPNMECGPCMLEPIMGEVLHGHAAANIELLTMSEVVGVVGSYGNFAVKIKNTPRYVDPHKCVGCAECIAPCPVSTKNEFNYGLSERKAIDFPFPGALPNSVFIDAGLCVRWKGEDCHLCKDACPVEDAVIYHDEERTVERTVGAVLLTIGSQLYNCKNIPNLGYGTLSDVYTSLEFERIAASNGPTNGEIKTSTGSVPESVAIMQCVGSLDKNHCSYCSGVCCLTAFKFNQVLAHKLPSTKIMHFYKEITVPGKEEFVLFDKARNNPNATFVRYDDIADFQITDRGGKKHIAYKDEKGISTSVTVDAVVLCAGIVPPEGSPALSKIFEVSRDGFGFFEELHGRTDSAQSKMKGVYLAGTCQSPMDIQRSMTQAMAATGFMLSGLVPGRKLEISPTVASVTEERCSGCRTCVPVCPYNAISYDGEKDVSRVNDLLCQGCGTCVAACPSGAIIGFHFTNEQIMAELEEVLQ